MNVARLDREERGRHDVVITCSDGGTPPLSASKRVAVTVNDVNDNAPRFADQVYASDIDENNYVGAIIAQVSCPAPSV